MTVNQGLRDQQNIVKKGIAFSVITTLGLILGVYYDLDSLQGVSSASEKLVFTLRCDVIATLMLLLGIIAVGNSRFFSEAIDPLADKERGQIIVYGQYTENTLQQLVLFIVTTLTLSTFLDAEGLRIIPAMTVTFVIGRIAFLIGYLHHPLHRAFGMAMTFYPTAIGLLCAVYLICLSLISHT